MLSDLQGEFNLRNQMFEIRNTYSKTLGGGNAPTPP